jgi:hypothetical protein
MFTHIAVRSICISLHYIHDVSAGPHFSDVRVMSTLPSKNIMQEKCAKSLTALESTCARLSLLGGKLRAGSIQDAVVKRQGGQKHTQVTKYTFTCTHLCVCFYIYIYVYITHEDASIDNVIINKTK